MSAGFILALMLVALMMTAQADGDALLSARETVYPRVKTAILDEAGYSGIRVRHAAPGERLDILSSKHSGPWCWLQSQRWLAD